MWLPTFVVSWIASSIYDIEWHFKSSYYRESKDSEVVYALIGQSATEEQMAAETASEWIFFHHV